MSIRGGRDWSRRCSLDWFGPWCEGTGPALMRLGRSTRRERDGTFMGSALKNDELKGFRESLLNLRARLRGDLDQMTDEALKRNQPAASSNLSNMPLHMADLGTENFDQEFTLGLIENEQAIVEE